MQRAENRAARFDFGSQQAIAFIAAPASQAQEFLTSLVVGL